MERRFAGPGRGKAAIEVLTGIDLVVPAGQFLAVLGPSGCGKSTLLRLVAALDHGDGGTIRIDGQVIDRGGRGGRGRARSRADDIAFVFQEAQLLPWRTLVRNVELPLELSGVARGERRDRATAMLAQLGLADAGDRYPGQLSGGMQMRGSLARALVTEPRLLLLDEPFAALDEITRERLDDLLHRLWRARGLTVLFVTHSITEALFLSERVIMLSRRPARIVADRPVALPAERTFEVRSTVALAEQAGALYRDLLVAEGEAAREASGS